MSTSTDIFYFDGKDNKNTKGEEKMLFGKCDKKRGTSYVMVLVGALAVIGAASITNKGRKMISSACCKVKSMVGRGEEE